MGYDLLAIILAAPGSFGEVYELYDVEAKIVRRTFASNIESESNFLLDAFLEEEGVLFFRNQFES